MSSLLERIQEALAPDYRVERTIASGGMGTVFLGRDQRLERPVAIKVLREEIATAVAVQRFIQEAQHLASLNHRNIVRVHDAGEADNLVYYVMDYVDGETLEDRLERGPLSLTETLRLGRQLLSALELAHRNRVVHRDIKPSNVFSPVARRCSQTSASPIRSMNRPASPHQVSCWARSHTWPRSSSGTRPSPPALISTP